MTDDEEINSKYGSEFLIIPYEHDLSVIIDIRAIDEVMYCKRLIHDLKNFISFLKLFLHKDEDMN
jgi:hypothetical protein